MKKQNHLIRSLSWVVLLAGLVCASQVIRADVVYDNTTGNTGTNFAQSGFQFGDEIILNGSGNRFLTNFTLQYFGSNFSGGEQMRLRLYRNDGALYGTNFNAPGTCLYDSGAFSIVETNGATLIFNQANSGFAVPVPSNFTWTVEFYGMTNGQVAGLALYSPPTVGFDYDEYWELSGTNDSWAYMTAGATPINFAAQISADTVSGDAVIPTIKITTPPKNKKFFAPTYTDAEAIGGTAADDIKLGLVLIKVEGGNYKPAITANGWSDWGGTLTWTYGTNNNVYAKSVDAAGNESTVAVVLGGTLRVTNQLTLNIVQPAGTTNLITPSSIFNGSWQELGKVLKITAKADSRSIFSNIVDSVSGGTNVPKYSFVMSTGLVLTVNFVTNRFYDSAGTYNGLFSVGGSMTLTNAGFFTGKVKAVSGKVAKFTSGKLYLDGNKVSVKTFSLGLDGSGISAETLRPSPKYTDTTPLVLRVQLPFNGSDTLSGTVSNSSAGWVSTIDADRATFGGGGATNYAGIFTMVVPGTNNANLGDGYGLLTIDTNGVIKLSGGKLADDESFKQKVDLSKNGEWPLYSAGEKTTADPKENRGTIMGWVTVSSTPSQNISGHLVWLKKPGGTIYPSGLTNESDIVASLYSGDPGANMVIPLTGGLGNVILAGGGLGTSLTNEVSLEIVNSKNKFNITNKVNKLSLSLTPKTGKLAGGFTDPNSSQKGKIGGVVLTNANIGRGYFHINSPANLPTSGTFLLE